MWGTRDVRQCSSSAPVGPAVFSTIGQTDHYVILPTVSHMNQLQASFDFTTIHIHWTLYSVL